MAIKKTVEIPTIDVNLVSIKVGVGGTEYILDTASKIAVEPQIETTDAKKLIIKGVLKAQKPEMKTLTGNIITLTDNVFSPEIVEIMQGGAVEYDEVETTKIIGYTPPVIGSTDLGDSFTLCAYSAQYNAAGTIVQYEKIEYPNCTGGQNSFGSEDGVFRAPEYKITSMPDIGVAPYTITYVDALPVVTV